MHAISEQSIQYHLFQTLNCLNLWPRPQTCRATAAGCDGESVEGDEEKSESRKLIDGCYGSHISTGDCTQFFLVHVIDKVFWPRGIETTCSCFVLLKNHDRCVAKDAHTCNFLGHAVEAEWCYQSISHSGAMFF